MYQGKSGENVWENFLSSKPDERYLRGINRQSEKRQEVIKNNSKYKID